MCIFSGLALQGLPSPREPSHKKMLRPAMTEGVQLPKMGQQALSGSGNANQEKEDIYSPNCMALGITAMEERVQVPQHGTPGSVLP